MTGEADARPPARVTAASMASLFWQVAHIELPADLAGPGSQACGPLSPGGSDLTAQSSSAVAFVVTV